MISSLIEMVECAEVEELVAVDENEEKAEERVVEGIEVRIFHFFFLKIEQFRIFYWMI